MTSSMTAFATQDLQLPTAIARWEIRSVNHRYLEVSFKLPPLLGDLEYQLREILRNRLSRGKVDCSLKLETIGESSSNLVVDFKLIDQLVAISKKMKDQAPEATFGSIFDILRWPSVVKMSEEDFSKLNEPLQKSFVLTLEELIEVRHREGIKLKDCIEKRLQKMHIHINDIKTRLPEIQNHYRQKFSEKIHEMQLELDESRLEQAMLHLLQKMDISEELDRLATHLSEVERILAKDKVMGRRLDFLMQELNREANTLAAKALDKMTAQDTIALKVLIEEMREQIQNLE